MSKPKRQHVVPQMLLRSFADPSDPQRIWQLAVDDDSEPTRVSIKNAAVVKHYYTHFRDRAYKPDEWFWEELLAEWEGKAATAIRGLEANPDQLAAPAGLLVFLQMLRTPLGQALLAEQAEAERLRVFRDPDFRVWTAWWADRKGRLPDVDEWLVLREAAAGARDGREHPLLVVGPTSMLDEMMTVVRHSGFGERLWDDGHWNVLNDDMYGFVIGDEPVTYRAQENPGRPVWAQLELPEELTMPIAPDKCIEVRRSERHMGLDGDEIAAINVRAVEWATQFIYGPDPEALRWWRKTWQQDGCPYTCATPTRGATTTLSAPVVVVRSPTNRQHQRRRSRRLSMVRSSSCRRASGRGCRRARRLDVFGSS